MQSSENARFVVGNIKLVRHMGDELAIVNAARMSFDKHKDELDDKDIALLRSLVRNHHTSPLEHVVFTFEVHCPLFVRAQWFRHRTWSFSEVSRRYTSEGMDFFMPSEDEIRMQSADAREASVDGLSPVRKEAVEKMEEATRKAFAAYQELLDMGVSREQARMVLPQNLNTTFLATVDLNNLIKFLQLRSGKHAQSEIRVYAECIKELITPIVPHIVTEL